MEGIRTRVLVRALVAVGLCSALIACATAPLPHDLPALALRQPSLYRLEIALLVFYSSLLIITPAVSGLLWGRLPTEISIRGASFAAEANRSAELDEAAVKKLERALARIAADLAQAKLRIEEPKHDHLGDKT